MKRISTTRSTILWINIVTMSSLFMVLGCQIQNQPVGVGDCAQPCSASSECSLGQVCAASGCCESYEASGNGCEPGSPDCMTIDEICSNFEMGCSCEILANGDYQLPGATPVITTSSTNPLVVDARVSQIQGNVLSNNGFAIYSDDPTCIGVEQNHITGADYPCSTTIIAEFGKDTLC